MPEVESESRTVVLGPTSYIREPVAGAQWTGRERQSSPRVILVFGWMSSSLHSLSRYIKPYDDLYPSATQILIRCLSTTFLASSAAQRAILLPVADKIEELLLDDKKSNSRGVLIHIFSNGGCFQFITLSDLLHSRPSLHLAMPSAIVFDSCPVRYEVSSVRRLASVFLPDFPLHFRLDALALVTLAVLVQVRIAWAQLGPFNSPCGDLLATQWDRLHQTNLYPWFTKDTKRLYLYSRVDPVTSQAVVEEHMEDARKHGLHVDKVLFDESLHIFHLKKYPEQYWGAVKRVWDDASVLSGRQHKL